MSRIFAVLSTATLALAAALSTGPSAYAAGADTTPPTVPGNVRASVTCTPEVTLTWSPSTDDTAVTGYDVFRATGTNPASPFTQVATTATTTFTEKMTNVFRYEIRARDAAGNTSDFSTPLTVYPPGCPVRDTQPPTTPGTPTATAVTDTTVSLSWAASTDNAAVTAYEIYRALDPAGQYALAGTSTTTTFADTGLTPAVAYTYVVRARDAAGNVSGFSPAITVRTAASSGCAATLTVQTAWATGYVMQPNTVTNTGPSTINGWTVTFTLPTGHTIVSVWNAIVTVNGNLVTVRPVPGQNAVLAPGATTTWGLQAARTSDGTTPAMGVTCKAS